MKCFRAVHERGRFLFEFEVVAKDSGSSARRGRFITPHGPVETPCFMPVGTKGTVKGMLPAQLEEAGAQVVLANAYHLSLRPGADRVSALGGLHDFMGWDGPILTDSGGFQVFSLSGLRSVDDRGVVFRNHLDGSLYKLTPEISMADQALLGADIIMALDECPPSVAGKDEIEKSLGRTSAWLKRCVAAKKRDDQALFGIVQGGLDLKLRTRHAKEVAGLDLPGYAIGGLSVGEDKAALYEVAGVTAAALPEDKPRYLMGVGTPKDLVTCIGLGIDLFDCVLPTRTGRTGRLYHEMGYLNIRNAVFAEDARPIDENCNCPACRNFTRAYLRHLYMNNEMLGPILGTLHNLYFYLDLAAQARNAIEAGDFRDFATRMSNIS
ncbi:MAG: tRNA guanosine(34) transglycosylase Tgt [Deltaproteobacteria bacterium]|nr:tRNA guanosine(34) transglycosylase Tgt [Deltaproteobacteria bacterium]